MNTTREGRDYPAQHPLAAMRLVVAWLGLLAALCAAAASDNTLLFVQMVRRRASARNDQE